MRAVLELTANVLIEAHTAAGRLVSAQRVRNKVTATGRNVMRDLLLNVGQAPTHIAVGTAGGVSSPSDTDTALNAEVFRNVFTRTYQGGSKATYKLLLKTTDANGNTLNEAGIFAGSSYLADGTPLLGGQMVARVVYSPIVKDNTVQLTITWEVQIRSV